MNAHRPCVLVTGAGGFIGGALARALGQAGFDARAGARRRLEGAYVACDLDKPETLGGAVAGADLVIHAAYGDIDRMRDQCANLLAAMDMAKVRRLIFFSSIAVYGDAVGAIEEKTATPAARDAYGAAKADCERLIADWTGRGERRQAFILRPGIVYGAGSHFWIDKLATRIRAGAWGVFGDHGEGSAQLLHIDDLAAFVTLLAGADASLATHIPVTMNLVGPDQPAWNDYFQALAAAIGAPPLTPISFGAWQFRHARAVAAKLWRKAGLPGGAGFALAPTSGEMDLFARKAFYATEIAQAYGFRPLVDLQEGLRRSFQEKR